MMETDFLANIKNEKYERSPLPKTYKIIYYINCPKLFLIVYFINIIL